MRKLSEIFSSLIQASMKKPSTFDELRCLNTLIETFCSFLFSQFKILETLHHQIKDYYLFFCESLGCNFRVNCLFVSKFHSYAKAF